MTLTDEDLVLLRAEGCVVDAEAAAMAMFDRYASFKMRPDLYSWDRAVDLDRAIFLDYADAALRSQRLTPGQPSLDLLAAAIERRGWFPAVIRLNERDTEPGRWLGEVAFPLKPDDINRRIFRRVGDDRRIALALAFCAALRAEEGTDGR